MCVSECVQIISKIFLFFCDFHFYVYVYVSVFGIWAWAKNLPSQDGQVEQTTVVPTAESVVGNIPNVQHSRTNVLRHRVREVGHGRQ